MLIAEISNGAFIGFMAVFSAFAWFFGWLIGRMKDPVHVGAEALAQTQTEREHYKSQLVATRGKLGKRETEVRDLVQNRAGLTSQLDKARGSYEALLQEHNTLKSRFTETADRIPPLESRIAALAPIESEFKKSEDERTQLGQKYEQTKGELEAARRECVSIANKVSDRDQRIAALAPFETKYSRSEDQRVAAERKLAETVKAKDTEINGLKERVSTLSPYEAKLRDSEKQRAQLGETVKSQDNEINGLKERVSALSPYEAKHRESEKQRAQLSETVKARETQIHGLKERVSTLTPYEAKYNESEKQHDTTRRELDATRRRLATIEPEIEKRDQRITALTPYETKYRNAEQQRAALQREYDEAIRKKNSELEQARVRINELSPLPVRLRERERRIEQLEAIEREHRGCAETITRLRSRQAAPQAPAAAMRQLVQRPITERDDLKKIWGIGKVFERQLNEMGYYRYRDIAAWNTAEVVKVAETIGSFPDRILRDRWIDQARDFASANA